MPELNQVDDDVVPDDYKLDIKTPQQKFRLTTVELTSNLDYTKDKSANWQEAEIMQLSQLKAHY